MTSPPRSEPVDLTGRWLFITGGTGFLGRSWLDYLVEAVARRGPTFRATVLSRDPESFLARFPAYAGHPWLTFVRGDLDQLPEAQADAYTDVIHGAADTHRAGEGALAWLDQLVQGTRRVLDFAVAAGAQRFLLLSSGAVYGRADAAGTAFCEDALQAPSPTDTAAVYAHGKRMAESLCALYSQESGLACVIARCFAVVSAYVPLDGAYAVGNFLRDALDPERAQIGVRGDGTAVRTYLDGRDMAHWTLVLLLKGAPGEAYNMGSDQPVTMLELAQGVAEQLAPGKPVVIENRLAGGVRSVYIPSIDKARKLGLAVETPLPRALAFAGSILTRKKAATRA